MLTRTKKTANKRVAHEIDTHIGSRIKMRRLELGLSQEHLAATLGLSFQQVQKYEKGVNRVSGGRLAAIAHELKVDVAFFYKRETDPDGGDVPVSVVQGFLGTSSGMRVAKAFIAIESSAARAAIVDLVEALAGPARCDDV
ncbi:helix-turn-helix domain-containing protein [Bradyrhizobium oligotrophicum S58]